MKNKKVTISFIITAVLAALFAAFTFVIKKVDVQPIGPEGSSVGLASVNEKLFNLIGRRDLFYRLSDWLGILPLFIAAVFLIAIVVQFCTRHSFYKVDKDLYALAAVYALLAVFYLAFEIVVINYRPVILNEGLEASYPSSHTMLSVCILGTAMVQYKKRIKDAYMRTWAYILTAAVMVFIPAGRLLGGVHWATDIVGGALLGATLVMLYYSVCKLLESKAEANNEEK